MSTAAPLYPPEAELGDYLRKLEPARNEGQLAFLGRLAGVADEYAENSLTALDIRAAESLLPLWKLDTVSLNDEDWGVARRAGQTAVNDQEILTEYRTPRRIVGSAPDGILMVARKALTGGDLKIIFEIEQAAAELAIDDTAAEEPEPKPAPTPSFHRPPESEPSEPSLLVLSEGQKDALWLLGLSKGKMTDELNATEEAIKTRLVIAQQNNGMDRKQLLTVAMSEGRIDMSLLPEQREYTLTDREEEVLREHSFSSLEDTAASFGLGRWSAVKVWRSIYKKLGVDKPSTRTQAFLIAKRDGVI